jgi:predicted Fe-S protein YdhL (DUF1289 family)
MDLSFSTCFILSVHDLTSFLLSFTSRFALTTVPSPCINWCDINPENGFCRGCYRTLNEIADWSDMTNPEKLEVWAQLSIRKPQAPQ